MLFINADTLEYPRFQGDMELDPTANWQEVERTEPPVTKEGEIAYEIAPKNVKGKWKMVWATRPLTEKEISDRKIEEIKMKVMRNIALTQEEALLLTSL